MSETPTPQENEQAFNQHVDESLAIANNTSAGDRSDTDSFLHFAAERSQVSTDSVVPSTTHITPEISKGKKVLRNVAIGGVIATAAAPLAYGAVSTIADIFIEGQDKQVEENKRLAEEQLDFQNQLDNGKVIIDQTENK